MSRQWAMVIWHLETWKLSRICWRTITKEGYVLQPATGLRDQRRLLHHGHARSPCHGRAENRSGELPLIASFGQLAKTSRAALSDWRHTGYQLLAAPYSRTTGLTPPNKLVHRTGATLTVRCHHETQPPPGSPVWLNSDGEVKVLTPVSVSTTSGGSNPTLQCRRSPLLTRHPSVLEH